MLDRREQLKNSRLAEHDNTELNRGAESSCNIPFNVQNDPAFFIVHSDMSKNIEYPNYMEKQG
jgi:hypothetical protein